MFFCDPFFPAAVAPQPVGYAPAAGAVFQPVIDPATAAVAMLSLVVTAAVVVSIVMARRDERRLTHAATQRALRDRHLMLLSLALGYVALAASMLLGLHALLAVALAAVAIFVVVMVVRQGGHASLYSQLTRLESLQRKLDDASLDAKRQSQLLKTLAHDLRNPLAAVTLHAELAKLEMSRARSADVSNALTYIAQCASETKDILDDFLEVSRMQWDEESVHIAEVDATRLVSEIVATLAPQATAKNLELNTQIQPDTTLVTDRSKLYRIIMNLLSNAVKYTNKGHIDVQLKAKDGAVTIAISDTGPGIGDDQMPHLFEEFYQVSDVDHDPREGFGLGLTITQKLVQQLGGKLAVQSTVGQGSSFAVTLPKSFAAARTMKLQQKQAPAA